MNKLKTLIFGLMLFITSTMFGQSLSVEPTTLTMYYKIPTSVKINHTAIGTWQWYVGISLDNTNYLPDIIKILFGYQNI